eukprot:scaffold43084_cov60-Phaeocystis_antarctica.AAC.5
MPKKGKFGRKALLGLETHLKHVSEGWPRRWAILNTAKMLPIDSENHRSWCHPDSIWCHPDLIVFIFCVTER